MPQVPVAPLPSQELRPQRTAQYTPDDFGASTGRAMMQVGQTLQNTSELIGRHVEEKQQRDDETAILNAQAKLQDKLRPVLYDPEKGLLAQRGEQTTGLVERAQEAFKSAREEAAAGLAGNPRASAKFGQMATRTEQSNLDQIARHRETQALAARDQASRALVESSTAEAANGYQDPAVIQRSINTATGAVMSNLKGAPKEAVDLAVLNAKSQIHTAVVDRLLVDDPRKAAEYYQANKDGFNGSDHAKILGTLKPKLQAFEADDRFQQIAGSNAGVGQLATSIASVPLPGAPAAAGTPPADPGVSLAPGAPIAGSRISAGVKALAPSVEQVEFGGSKPGTLSSAGAAGVMQVMPDTAIDISTRILKDGVFPAGTPKERIQEALSSNPGLARRYGTAYLQHLSDRYHGDVETALVAYNAGPANADKWLRAGRDYGVLPKPEETEPYVSKVLEHFTGARGGTPGVQARAAAGAGVTLPPVGRRMTAENWSLEFYKPQDLIGKTDAAKWVDARSATMADILGKTFFEKTGIRVAINDDHDTPGTSGKRRGTRDPEDNPGAKGSQHLHGRAFDFQIQGLSTEQKADFLRTARSLGFAGVGFYPGGHIHLDTAGARSWGPVPAWAQGAMATAPAPSGAFGVSGISSRNDGAPGPVYTMPGQVPTNARSVTSIGGITAPASIPGALPDASVGGIGMPASPVPVLPTTTTTQVAPNERDLEHWLSQARDIADPTVRASVVSKLNSEYERRKKVHGLNQQNAYEDAFKQVIGGKQASDISQEQLLAMGPEKARSLLTFAEKRNAGTQPAQDWQLWGTLATMTDQDLAKTSLFDYRNKLDDAHFDKLSARYQAITSAGVAEGKAANVASQKAQETLAGYRDRGELVKDALREVAGDTDLTQWLKTPANARVAGVLNSRLDDAIAEHTRRVGKAPNPEETAKMLDRLMIKTYKSDGILWDTGAVRSFQLDPEEVDKTVPEKAFKTYKDVPTRERVEVREFWKGSTGKIPTEGELVALYPQIVRARLGMPQVTDPPKHEMPDLTNALKKRFGRDPSTEEVRAFWGRVLTDKFGGK